MFEDTGKVSFARCRPVASGAAHSTAPAAAPATARRRAPLPLAVCPDGYAPR
jgi:hypothetical protein